MNKRTSITLAGLLCLACVAGAPSPPASAQTGPGGAGNPPDPEVLERLRFPAKADHEVPSQEAYAGWPPPELRRRSYWLPWTWQAFQRAALFGRPVVFVMTVNWSYPALSVLTGPLADPTVTEDVNRDFVSVLVNADRRPDLKERYQTGDWPVIAFLLPDGNPMLSQANDLGVAQPITTSRVDSRLMRWLLSEADTYWKKWPELLVDVGTEWTRRSAEREGTPGVADELASDQIAMWLEGNADRAAGGFGVAPKFMVPGFAEYAAIRSARLKNELRSHSRLTLEKLLASPMYDAAEGGIHRLAAAPDWGAIQYEKRLTGNTALVQQLLVRLREEESPALHAALVQTAAYIVGTLGRPGGGFYNAQSADLSTADGGAYWTAEVRDPRRAPPVDKLVLAGPNARAGAALIRAGLFLDDSDLVKSGRRAIDTVLETVYAKSRGVGHVVDPQPEGRIFLTAQADVALGLLDAYECLGEARYLTVARDLVDFARTNLRHEGYTALADTLPLDEPVGLLTTPRFPLRPNVRMARAMIRLALHGEGDTYRESAGTVLSSWAGDLAPYGVQATEAALAIEELVRTPLMIRIDGAPGSAKTRELRSAALRSPWPWTLVLTGRTRGRAQAEFEWRGVTTKITSAEEVRDTILSATGLETR